jgi:hypothetical protein
MLQLGVQHNPQQTRRVVDFIKSCALQQAIQGSAGPRNRGRELVTFIDQRGAIHNRST